MHQDHLNDAAIALSRALSNAGIKFGIFGGYAITVLGGQRETKDIDCFAAPSKQVVINLLDGKDGFVVVPQTREDYVAFLWSETPKSTTVLVEVFCEQFPGARYSMGNIRPNAVAINGKRNGAAPFLDPVYIFKGKLCATANRAKFHDPADLRWLEGRFRQTIKARGAELNSQYVGLAMKRYPELETLFIRLGIDVAVAKNAASTLNPNNLPRPAPGDVQQGILG